MSNMEKADRVECKAANLENVFDPEVFINSFNDRIIHGSL